MSEVVDSTTIKLMNTNMVAQKLGISDDGVRKAAEKMGVGKRLGKFLVFTQEDVERLRARPPRGHPPTPKPQG